MVGCTCTCRSSVEALRLARGSSSVRARHEWVGTRAAWAEAGVLVRAVVPGAFAAVVVAADLLRTGR